VDRILLGLVAQGFTQFIRVGSLKKIAKPILPFTLHESRRNAKSGTAFFFLLFCIYLFIKFYFQDFDDDRDALKDLNDMMHHDSLSSEEMKYVKEMITAIKGGAHKNKKKELKSIRVIGIFGEREAGELIFLVLIFCEFCPTYVFCILFY
jgi:hypothetical protein